MFLLSDDFPSSEELEITKYKEVCSYIILHSSFVCNLKLTSEFLMLN